ncbi:MAG: hypothetical protein IPK39_08985 [Sulfuritalea sp.]|nr:hypothetical protein [Sulfuritalea sp.]
MATPGWIRSPLASEHFPDAPDQIADHRALVECGVFGGKRPGRWRARMDY